MYLKTVILFLLGLSSNLFAVEVNSYRIEDDFMLTADVESGPWSAAEQAYLIENDWQGNPVEPHWHTEVKSLWTDKYLYVLYIANFDILAPSQNVSCDENGDCWGVWNYDACEMFIGDNPDIKKYFEFVCGPDGRKIDIRHNKNLPKGNDLETGWTSLWQARVEVLNVSKQWTCRLKIPMKAIANTQIEPGKVFRANFYRISGDEEEYKDIRRYMALNPTNTEKPSFHVPENFGTLKLVSSQKPLPEPALRLDVSKNTADLIWNGRHKSSLDNAEVLRSAGPAGTDCLDFWRTVKPSSAATVEDEFVSDSLNHLTSLTITGWVNRELDFGDSQASDTQYVMNCPGRFHLMFDQWSRMALRMFNKDGKIGPQIYSSWLSTNHLNPGSRWVFFAFTLDTAKKENNARFYVGSEKYPVFCDTTASISADALASSDLKKLIFGAYNEKGDGILKGMLAGIRVYASAKPSHNAAVSADMIERIRQDDLGKEWLLNLSRLERAQAEDDRLKKAALADEYYCDDVNLHQVGSLERIISTIPPEPLEMSRPFGIYPGGKLYLQFAASGKKAGTSYEISPGMIEGENGQFFDGYVNTYRLEHVPVEANNNGGINTSLTTRPPQRWMEYLIAEAPFKAAEVLVKTESITLKENSSQPDYYSGILLEVCLSRDVEPGIYRGELMLKDNGKQTAAAPFSFRVYDVYLEDEFPLHSYHWLMPEPENLMYDEPLQWWSDEYWLRLSTAMDRLRDFGQDCINIPLLNYGPFAPIRTLKTGKGYDFDFTLFDEYFQMALDKGFVQIAGSHILWLPSSGSSALGKSAYQGVYIWDSLNEEPQMLFSAKYDQDEWLEFVPVFYDKLYAHLKAKGWADYYVQQQYDEPKDARLYERISRLTREHMPGVKTMDAIKTKPEYSDLVDIMVFDINLLRADAQQLAAQRKAGGKDVWFYHCCSPYPPYPNRHLDDPLSSSRLYPWLAWLGNSDGYLWWAVNVYRGADPYKTSIGPLPGGSQNPGHGPGDNWMYYPGPDGLRGSMRMAAFRDGLADNALLRKLAAVDKEAAKRIMRKIALSPVEYSREPQDYYDARIELLEALEKTGYGSTP
jgi:hypothetical protein